MYQQMKPKISELLLKQRRISFTVDCWTSMTATGTGDYMAILAHFIDEDWTMKKVLVGFEPLKEKHTGKVIHERMFVF